MAEDSLRPENGAFDFVSSAKLSVNVIPRPKRRKEKKCSVILAKQIWFLSSFSLTLTPLAFLDA